MGCRFARQSMLTGYSIPRFVFRCPEVGISVALQDGDLRGGSDGADDFPRRIRAACRYCCDGPAGHWGATSPDLTGCRKTAPTFPAADAASRRDRHADRPARLFSDRVHRAITTTSREWGAAQPPNLRKWRKPVHGQVPVIGGGRPPLPLRIARIWRRTAPPAGS